MIRIQPLPQTCGDSGEPTGACPQWTSDSSSPRGEESWGCERRQLPPYVSHSVPHLRHHNNPSHYSLVIQSAPCTGHASLHCFPPSPLTVIVQTGNHQVTAQHSITNGCGQQGSTLTPVQLAPGQALLTTVLTLCTN